MNTTSEILKRIEATIPGASMGVKLDVLVLISNLYKEWCAETAAMVNDAFDKKEKTNNDA